MIAAWLYRATLSTKTSAVFDKQQEKNNRYALLRNLSKHPMKPKLWLLLAQISQIQSTIKDHLQACTQHAIGTVWVKQTAANQLQFNEQGTIEIAPNKILQFTNTYQFTLNPNQSISLSHLRRGKATPVHLLTFFADNPNTWLAPAPHFCGEDVYQARMEIDTDNNQNIKLAWRIQGANKNAWIDTVYA